jgi:3-deoxy-D-arabino-heptulosonate 7-phosphate (DAHP) synthase
MPKAFLDCIKNGGKVRTINLQGNKYCHICSIGGKTYRGEVKTKKGGK